MRARPGPASPRWLWLLVLMWPWGALAQSTGLITMTEGPLRLIRDAAIHSGAGGVALKKGDILETGSAGFIQMELADGTVVALGPDSRLFVFDTPATAGDRKRTAQLVLMRGWLKAETPGQEKAQGAHFWIGSLSVSAKPGSLVSHVTPAATRLFVEAGTVEIAPAEKTRAQSATARAGQFVVRDRTTAPLVRGELPPGFVAEMPRAFRDTLPPLAQRFRQPAPAPKPERQVGYEDVADVLALPVAFRTGFIRRFENRLADADFRRALDANMRRHPEWDRVLHPERYEPPPRPLTDIRPGRQQAQ